MKRKTFFVLLAAFLCCFADTLSGQTVKNITGKAVDTLGEELPGVSVTVKGTNTGTITGIDGTFTLKVEASGVLQFSFVGYKNQTLTVGDQTFINVVMEEESQSLDEVVVVAVGYGDVRRRDLTGSIGKANMDDLTKTPVTNIAESLGGRIAGVQVSSTDGGLGDNFNITIRGAGSLTQSTAPLYVIDGFPQETSGMSSLNPNDIESIDILKDASATAIYGSRGANGVVIITTKKGRAGKPSITYNGSMTVGVVGQIPDLMNAYEFVRLQQEVMSTEDFETYYLQNGNTLEGYKRAKTYDWQDEIFRTAISHNHHVLMNGQQADLRYSASLSYSDQEGVITNSDLSRYQGRLNLSQQFNKRLKVDFNANYASTVQNGPTASTATTSLSSAFMYSVWAYRPVSPSGSDLMAELYDGDVNMTEDYRFNPVLSVRNEYRRNTTNNLQANASLEYEIIDNLKLKIAGGYTARDYKSEEFNGSQTRTGNSHPSNSQSKGINAKLTETENRSYLNENTLTYQFKKYKHHVNLLGGITFQKSSVYTHSITAEHITNESFGMAGLNKGSAVPVVGSSKGENALMSYLARMNYNYDSRYYLTASFRADGSSKFPKNNRWGYFSSGSLAWAFSREAFVKENVDWLSNGKVRVSWGQTGNNRIGNYDYMAHLITSSNMYKYPWNSNFHTGYVSSSMANDKLKWETTEQLDFGLDLGFFNGRINLTADYYIKTTKDLLLNADTPASAGYSTATLNVGKLRNKGLELTLETVNIKTQDFNWTSSFNIAFNNNKIIALNSGQEQMTSFVNWDNKYRNMPAYISKIGAPAGQMYGFIYEGTYKVEDFDVSTDGNGNKIYTLKKGIPYYSGVCQPGDPKYKNISGDDDIINDDDKVAIGNGHPKHIGGFSNNFVYKNFDLNIFFQWSYGNDVLNVNRMVYENPSGRKNTNMFASYVNRWAEDNPTSNMPRARAVGSEVYSSLYVEDGSYLKLKNISLGYTLPENTLRALRISTARIYVAAENIATFTSYSGPDPEVSTRHSVLTPGFDWSAYPRSFNASLGVNITF